MASSEKGGLAETAGAVIGGLSTIGGWLGIGEKRQDRRQLRQQEALNDINKKTAKEMADYENAGKLNMWKDTNYGAQLEQAKLAGVSKAAAIGGGGGGGTQGASVGSVGGGSAADAASAASANASQSVAGLQAAAQLSMMKAQTENIKADTANKQAAAGNTNLQSEGQILNNKITSETMDSTVQEAAERVRKVRGEAETAFNKGEIDRETQTAQIRQIKQEAENKLVEKLEMEAGIKLDKAKVREIGEQIKQRWQDVAIGKYNAKTGRKNAKIGGMNAGTLAKKQLVDEMISKQEVELKSMGLSTQQQQNFMRNMIDIVELGTGRR